MKDFINYALSSMAVLMSMSALIFGVMFQRKERKRNIRQILTNNLREIAKVNVEVSRLKQEKNAEEPPILAIRKNYNLQRSILMIDADFLIHQKPEVMTSVDCSLMASTYEALGNPEKADYYWHECINKSDSKSLQHIHTREYATFLFNRNYTEEGRKEFEKALEIKPGKADDDWALIADTYLSWAKLEQSFKREKDFMRLIDLAYETCKNIRHENKLQDMKTRIDIACGKVKEKREEKDNS